MGDEPHGDQAPIPGEPSRIRRSVGDLVECRWPAFRLGPGREPRERPPLRRYRERREKLPALSSFGGPEATPVERFDLWREFVLSQWLPKQPDRAELEAFLAELGRETWLEFVNEVIDAGL